MPALDVLCVGSATLDTIALVSDIPGSDERVLTEAFVSAGGGPAATAAVTLARLGARVGLCAVVGDDDAGRTVLEGLRREGVLLDWVSVVPGTTTTQTWVLVSRRTAERTIVAVRAAQPDLPDLDPGLTTWVHVDQTGLGPVGRLRSRFGPAGGVRAGAGPSGVPLLSIDGGNGCPLPDLVGVTLYAPSAAALHRRYPDAASTSGAEEAALADGATWVVTTDGPRGASVRSASTATHVPAFALPAVSTLGAGDVFHGALLAGLVRGTTMTEAAREASAAAALSCRALDGRSAIPDRRELDDFLSPRARSRPEPGRELETT